MKKPVHTLISLCVFATLAACASRPDAIAPTPVSATDYAGLSCQETNALLTEKRSSLQEAERQQNRAATGDAIGVFLVLLPVGSILGEDNEGVVAQYKGEVIALERAMTGNCR
ncbi:MAG: hypothetical protein WD772_11185 [Pseudohongiellaceae bacterium]